MRKFAHFGARPAVGFTLIELMVVVLVITILTVIAVPSYLSATLKSHRAEAKSVMLDLAARQERFMATNGAYSQAPSDLGYTGSTWGTGITVGSGYYSVSLTNFAAASAGTATTAAIPAKFQFTATAINGQTKDTQCNTFTIDQSGLQLSTHSAAATSTGCW
jgi:type IV pilus assembly protein PilE